MVISDGKPVVWLFLYIRYLWQQNTHTNTYTDRETRKGREDLLSNDYAID